MKKTISVLLVLVLACAVAFAGGKKESTTEIYFLNFKPEVAEVYETEVAPAFAKENPGYTLKVVTAASGTYEQTFNSAGNLPSKRSCWACEPEECCCRSFWHRVL